MRRHCQFGLTPRGPAGVPPSVAHLNFQSTTESRAACCNVLSSRSVDDHCAYPTKQRDPCAPQ
eukprot:4452271-Amphidinium_carterae.1